MEARVVIVTFPAAQILDVTCPLEVFSSANRALGRPSYRAEVVSVTGGPVTATCGLAMATRPITAIRGPMDTLLVAGGQGTGVALDDELLLHHVRRLSASAHRVASVCTGAFVLAAAGLLDGRRATTHWAWCKTLADRYPMVTVEEDNIYVHDGDVWTSAGVTSGIDLALALVAADHGQEVAAEVARNLVVYLRRSGGQSQFSVPLAVQAAESEPVRRVLAWAIDHLAGDLSVAGLAARSHLSERQFTRVFKAAVGTTPADHVETMRLEAACRLLETTGTHVQQIARACGFGTTETMHRVFRRRLNTTPGQHRRHFQAA